MHGIKLSEHSVLSIPCLVSSMCFCSSQISGGFSLLLPKPQLARVLFPGGKNGRKTLPLCRTVLLQCGGASRMGTALGICFSSRPGSEAGHMVIGVTECAIVPGCHARPLVPVAGITPTAQECRHRIPPFPSSFSRAVLFSDSLSQQRGV